MSDETTKPMAEQNDQPNKAMFWTGWFISGLMILAFGLSGVMKLTPVNDETRKGLDHIGITESMLVPLAILELTCVVIYAIPQTAILGAILLAGYMGGAILTHWRVGDPFFVQIILGVLVWVGVYLREPRLRKFLPLR